jgi:hypothetical protein
MQRDEQRNNEEPKQARPPEEIVDASPPESPLEGDVDAADSVTIPEPPTSLDQSAEPASSLPTQKADLGDADADREPPPDPPREEPASSADTVTQPAGNVTRIELPADISIPLARPSEALRDRRSYLLPLDPRRGLEDKPDPVDQIFPPEWRLPLDPGDPAAPPRTPELARPEAGPPSDKGQTMPRVQVLVTLAGARALFEEVLEEAIERAAPKFERIAQSEIKRYDFRQETKRRAADYRLRGPG